MTKQDTVKISKQFCPFSKCSVNPVLSCPDPFSHSHAPRNVVTYCDVIWKLGQDYFSNAFTLQTRQNCSLSTPQYTENCLRLSQTKFTPPTVLYVVNCHLHAFTFDAFPNELVFIDIVHFECSDSLHVLEFVGVVCVFYLITYRQVRLLLIQLFYVLGYCIAMSDLNTACIADDFASDLTKNLETDVADAERHRCVKATVHDKLHEEQCMMTMYSECVWESCYTVPVKPINSKISKRKLHQSKKGESDDRLKTQNHVKQKYDAKRNKKTKASNKTKKSKLASPEKANLDRGIDTTLPAEKALLQAEDAKALSVVSGSTCAITDCIESVAVDLDGQSCYLPSDGFEYGEEEKISACNDDGVNVLETAPHSVPICQDLIALSDKNIFAENSDENKNILNDGILLEKACRESVEYTALLNYCDLAPGNRDLTVQCTVNDFIEHTVTQCEENTFAREQQAAAVSNKSKQRRSLRLMAGLRTNLEQADEKQDCSELGGLSAVEEHKGCTENPVQGIVKSFVIA